MYYVKCTNCGYSNELKSENLSFCSGCNKALDNSFSEWKKTNPGATFDEFKKQVCIPAEFPENTNPKKAKGKSRAFTYSIVTLVTGVFAFIGAYSIGEQGTKSIMNWFRSEKTADDVLTKKWVKDTYGSFGLTVETPEKMTKGDLTLPDNIKEKLVEMDIYNYESAKGFKVMINSTRIKDGISSSLQGGANGAVNQVKSAPGVTDFNYTEGQANKDSIPGIVQKGTYKQQGMGIEFIDALYAKGQNMWQVMVLYQDNDEIGRTAANRVISSIAINCKQ
ncbi:MAG TPA: hypothetical protein VNZ45_06545 [Bacteroidia bacterium]|jgi:hypothetical protein|nr:hypothetical protein [Bacteroidia bacterium]